MRPRRSMSRRTTGRSRRPCHAQWPASILGPRPTYWASCGRPLPGGEYRSVFADDSDDHALDQDIALLEPQRLHGSISRLEADPSACFTVKLLHRGLAAVDQCDDHFAIFGGLLAVHDDDISIHDVLVDHGRALHLQGIVGPTTGQHLVRNRDGFLMHERLDGGTSGYPAEQGNFGGC